VFSIVEAETRDVVCRVQSRALTPKEQTTIHAIVIVVTLMVMSGPDTELWRGF
jgi:hypothetical protein